MNTKRMYWLVLICTVALAAHPALAGEKPGKRQQFVVNLTSPISTRDSKPGDTFTAVVLEPAEFQGSVMEGRVRKVQPAENMESPKARISFAFETLTVGDTTYKIQADLTDVVNSKGVAKVDEEGQVVAKGNAGKRAMMGFGGAGIGSFAGGLLGGNVGSIVGSAVGGIAGYAIALDMTASSHQIEFNPGTHFTLSVTSKGVDKDADAAAIHQQETAAESAIAHDASPAPAPEAATAQAATANPAADSTSGPTPSPSPGPSPQK